MAIHSAHDITRILRDWDRGDSTALNELMRRVHGELRRLARSYLRRERVDHTLESSALVNEAYLRLVDQKEAGWQDRAHFFGIAAKMMRQILVDHARRHRAKKRGGSVTMLTLHEAVDGPCSPGAGVDVIALDQALEKLTGLDTWQSKVVELRFFGGLSVKEVAEVLGVSAGTVKREWATAKAWLYRELSKR
jgi:RNA polymerase sigma factor (TIGR02999 family)